MPTFSTERTLPRYRDMACQCCGHETKHELMVSGAPLMILGVGHEELFYTYYCVECDASVPVFSEVLFPTHRQLRW